MTFTTIKRFKVFAIAGLCCLMTGFVSAQDDDATGIVRITDVPANVRGLQIQQTTCDKVAGACDSGACATGNSCIGGNACGQCGQCTNGCPTGNCKCKPGHCQCGAGAYGGCKSCQNCPSYAGYGYGNGCNPYGTCPLGMILPIGGLSACGDGCGPCGAKMSNSFRKLMAIIDPCSGACTHSPTHGFVPPGESRPYFRQPVSYQHNYPASWMGAQPGAPRPHMPVVYMPTDTTQLGYYYQKVPTWVPVPGMIPPAPQPTEWHHYGQPGQYVPVEATPTIEEQPIEAAPEDASVNNPVVPPAPAAGLAPTAQNPALMPIVR